MTDALILRRITVPTLRRADGARLTRLWGVRPVVKDSSRAFAFARCRRQPQGLGMAADAGADASVRLPFVTGRYNLAALIALHMGRQRRRSLLKRDDR